MTDDQRFLHRACPLCGAKAPEIVEIATQPAAESLAYEDLVPCWNGFFKARVFFSYARCGTCGLQFAPIFFRERQLAALYEQMAPNMDVVPTEALERTQRGYFDTLKKHSKLEGSYVELGPDVGLLTQHCVRDGNFDNYWLFEPNRAVLPALGNIMADRPFQIIHDMLGFSAVPDGSVGAAVLVQVLDHLLEPATVLKELRSKIKPGGILMMVTHNESSLLRRVFGRNWPPFCLQHPELYNPKSMRRLLEVAGYELIEIDRSTNYFPVQFLFNHLLWAMGLNIKSTPRFGGLTIGLKLGNIITIARPKAQ